MIKHHTVTHVKIACLQHNKISQRCVTNKVKIGRRFLRHFDPHVPNCFTRHHISEGFRLAFFTPKERKLRLASASCTVAFISKATVKLADNYRCLPHSLPPWIAWIILRNRQQALPYMSLRIPHSSQPLFRRRVKYTVVEMLPKPFNLTQVWHRITASAFFCRVTWVEYLARDGVPGCVRQVVCDYQYM